jgi:hypothetical protein
MTEPHKAPEESLEPFSGDRGWKGLDRSEGEGVFFIIVAVLLVIAVLALLTLGGVGIGLVFLLLTFVSLGVLVIISMGG